MTVYIMLVVMLVVFDCIYFTHSCLSNILQLTPWINLHCPIYFMVFLGVYYTSLDIGELGAGGLMLTSLRRGSENYDKKL